MKIICLKCYKYQHCVKAKDLFLTATNEKMRGAKHPQKLKCTFCVLMQCVLYIRLLYVSRKRTYVQTLHWFRMKWRFETNKQAHETELVWESKQKTPSSTSPPITT